MLGIGIFLLILGVGIVILGVAICIDEQVFAGVMIFILGLVIGILGICLISVGDDMRYSIKNGERHILESTHIEGTDTTKTYRIE